MPWLAIALTTAMVRLDVPPPPPGTPGPLSRPTPEAIGGLLEGGGFSDVEVEEIDLILPFESAEEYTRFAQGIIAPVVTMISVHPEDVQRQTWDAITEKARERAGADGRFTLSNQVLVASGQA